MRRLPLVLLIPACALAQAPRLERAELEALYTEAGFPVDGGQPRNACAEPARPRVAFVDLNADRQPEALFVDASARCYEPDRRYFAVLGKQGGSWRLLLSGNGQVKAQPQRGPEGWLELKEIAQAGERRFRFDGQRYQPLPAEAAAPPPAVAPAGGSLSAADEAAAFKTAGFKRKGQRWVTEGCDEGSSYGPGSVIEQRDLNGDGRPEILLGEGGTFCYGNTGQGFWLLSRQPDGAWRLMLRSVGIADFLKSKGRDGFPDVQIGGPGFCFPVVRWNGRDYQHQRWEYEGRPCKPPR